MDAHWQRVASPAATMKTALRNPATIEVQSAALGGNTLKNILLTALCDWHYPYN
ncbi:TPA: hypothetical protein RQO21_004358 [Klebsiella michiganensis]|nr:hypothetical protein [Klebsiella michiganensis]